jgi:glycosyltransferase involved in cell wall biosynthesis
VAAGIADIPTAEDQVRLRVLQVVTDRDRRGAQVYAMDLHGGLEALGCTVLTVALAPGEHGDGLSIDALGPTRRSWKTFRALRHRAREHDVVIAHGSATLFACALALFGTGRPFVYRQISDPVFWASTWARRLRVAVFIRRARHVVCLAEGAATGFARHYRLDRSSLSVIPNAVPGERFEPPTGRERADARAELGVPLNAEVVLYVGAMVEEKGVDLAIRSLASRSSAHLVLAGDGPDRESFEALARQLLGDRAMFLGSVSDPRSLYRAADVLVMPTRGADSMPAVLIESGLCGLASVTCPVGAITEVVIDEETGLVVPVDDLEALSIATVRLLDDAELRSRLGANAARHCREHFTISATAPAWLEVMTAGQRRDR